MIRACVLSALILMLSPVAAPATTVTGAVSDSIEAPELGRRGAAPVGTSYGELMLAPRIRITAQGLQQQPRGVGLRLWYPAKAKGDTTVTYRHGMTGVDGVKNVIVERGAAFEGVSVAHGRFPLVVLSHGLGGWSEHMSRLGEHLASRGYVVAAIDHRDIGFTDVPAFLLSFGNVLVDRPADQREVIARLLDPKFANAVPALAAVDAAKVGLIGYSMGGYGALSTTGASYDPGGKPFAQLPEASRKLALNPDPAIAARIKAVVVIAPWGGQPESRAWTEASLSSLKVPVLMIAGDHDDAVNFKQGVRWIFDALNGTERRLLIYREAKHNVAGNAAAFENTPNFEAIGYAFEPVWRLERINQINQHFVTAFLDATLKGDASAARYLDVPKPMASDGSWPLAFGESTNGAYAGASQPGYWRGFQRGSATGIELHRKSAGE